MIAFPFILGNGCSVDAIHQMPRVRYEGHSNCAENYRAVDMYLEMSALPASIRSPHIYSQSTIPMSLKHTNMAASEKVCLTL